MSVASRRARPPRAMSRLAVAAVAGPGRRGGRPRCRGAGRRGGGWEGVRRWATRPVNRQAGLVTAERGESAREGNACGLVAPGDFGKGAGGAEQRTVWGKQSKEPKRERGRGLPRAGRRRREEEERHGPDSNLREEDSSGRGNLGCDVPATDWLCALVGRSTPVLAPSVLCFGRRRRRRPRDRVRKHVQEF